MQLFLKPTNKDEPNYFIRHADSNKKPDLSTLPTSGFGPLSTLEIKPRLGCGSSFIGRNSSKMCTSSPSETGLGYYQFISHRHFVFFISGCGWTITKREPKAAWIQWRRQRSAWIWRCLKFGNPRSAHSFEHFHLKWGSISWREKTTRPWIQKVLGTISLESQ